MRVVIGFSYDGWMARQTSWKPTVHMKESDGFRISSTTQTHTKDRMDKERIYDD